MRWRRVRARQGSPRVLVALVVALVGLLGVAGPAVAASNGVLWRFRTHDIVYGVALSPRGDLIAIGSRDSNAYALDRGGKLLWTYPTANSVNGVSVSSDGGFVGVASADRTVTLLTRAGHVVWKRTASGPLGAVAVSADARRVAYGVNDTSNFATRDQHLHMLDRSGRQIWSVQLSGDPLSIAITPDGNRIVVGADDDSVTLFDGAGHQLWQQGGSDLTNSVAISTNGQRVVAGSSDRHVYAYDARGRQLWTYAVGDKAHGVAISADGSRIAVASEDKSLYLLNGAGKLLYHTPTAQPAEAVGLSADAGLLVGGLDDGTVTAISIAAGVADAAAATRATIETIILVALLVVVGIGLYALFVRSSPRRRAVAERRLARARMSGRRVWRARLSYLLLLPTFIILIAFSYYPALSGLVHSFTAWNPTGETSFIGLTNFQAMFQDPYLGAGVVNLLIILLTGLVKTIAFPFLVAELIFHLRSRVAQYWARTLFVIPTIVPIVALILVWRFIYDPNEGLLNQFLQSVGLSGWTHSWLGEPGWALAAIIFIGFPWIGVLQLLVLYAGLIAIPGELLEAATVDGAGALRRIRSIHLPLLVGQVKLLAILLVISAIQDFQAILILTQGGPQDSTYVPALDMYFRATTDNNLGYASAIGVVLFVVIMIITVVQLRVVRTSTEFQP